MDQSAGVRPRRRSHQRTGKEGVAMPLGCGRRERKKAKGSRKDEGHGQGPGEGLKNGGNSPTSITRAKKGGSCSPVTRFNLRVGQPRKKAKGERKGAETRNQQGKELTQTANRPAGHHQYSSSCESQTFPTISVRGGGTHEGGQGGKGNYSD